jgi:Flp pilus assembly protein TadB
VLIGVHGAGLMLILFAANEACLIEIHPSYRQDRHFRHASRLSGKDYMPLRAIDRESCQGSSDNVKVCIVLFLFALALVVVVVLLLVLVLVLVLVLLLYVTPSLLLRFH